MLGLGDINQVFLNLINPQSFRKDTNSNPCDSVQYPECESNIQFIKPEHHKDTIQAINSQSRSPTQDATTLKAKSAILTQDHPRDISGLEKQCVEKPYNDGPKIRRILVADFCSFSNDPGTLNQLNSNTYVSQSDFSTSSTSAGQFGNLQTNANSGCDLDFYGLANKKNVLTKASEIPKSYWTAKLGTIQTINAILLIENQFDYSPSNYDNSWLSTYKITIGDNIDGFNNPVCVTLGRITKGGWFNCGLNGQYLSIISDTERIAFSEIMAYIQQAVQINAIDPPSCPFCQSQYPATRALRKEVTLAIGSLTQVQTDATTTNPTITFYLQAKIKIAAVVLIGCRELRSSQQDVTISTKKMTDAESACVTISDYNTYTESDCNNNVGNSVIVRRSSANLGFCGFGIFSNCNCAFSELYDPAETQQFTTPPTDTFVSGNLLSTVAGGIDVSITINFNIPDTVSSVCGNADGFTECGSREISYKDITDNIVVTTSPYKKVYQSCTSSTCTLTLKNTVNSDAGTWQFRVKLSLPTANDSQVWTRTKTITVTVKEHCTIPIQSMNLLGTDALPSQSTLIVGYNTDASLGCNGFSQNTAFTELVYTAASTSPINYWSVMFAQPVTINTLLIIGPEAPNISNLPKTKVTIGSSSDLQTNTACIVEGQITDGGWYLCSGSGIYLALWSTTNRITFYEIMAYASFPVQWNSISQTWNTVQASTTYPAANVLSKIVVVNDSDSTRQKCIASLAGTAATGSLSIKFKAQTTIKVVVLVPGRSAAWTNNQKGVTVKVTDVTQAVQDCGIITDYNAYAEKVCNQSGNLVTLERSATNVQLSFCSVGILAECDCSQSSFAPAQFTTPIVIQNALSTLVRGAAVSITIDLIDTVSSVCDNADGFTNCGSRTIQLTDLSNSQVISTYPYRKVTWSQTATVLAPTGTLTLQDTLDADVSTWQIQVKISLTANPAVTRTQVITVTVIGYCTTPIGSMNLLNTAALPSQSAFSAGQNTDSSIGCNGISTSTAASELVVTSANALPVHYWSVMLAQPVAINTLLLIGPEASMISNLLTTKVSIGSSSNFQTNPICLVDGQITDGGWYLCSGSGIYLALWSTTNSITFYEIMAYASFPVQWNSISQTWNTVQADPAYPAANVLSKMVVLKNLDTTRQKCIASLTGTASTGSLSLGFKAQTIIKVVVLVPGQNSAWTNNQKDLTVKVKDVSSTGTVSTCGIITDYNAYAEQLCNKSGNLVTLERSVAGVQLSFCSIGILTDCDCSQSSFDPAQFTTPIVIVNSLSTFIGSAALSVTIDLIDTVSSVCGNADGFTNCGSRTIQLTDLSNSQVITAYPYKKVTWSETNTVQAAKGTLTLQNTLNADVGTWQLQVKISLTANPAVTRTQVITVVVSALPLCTVPVGSMNLINAAALPLQSAYSAGNLSPYANMGCNGILESTATSELVQTAANSSPINYWSVLFAQTVAINTLLLIGPEALNISNLSKTKVSIGSTLDFQTNPICLLEGQITDGGWYLCSGSGNYLALWSATNSITFYEIMAYASFPVQWNSISQTWNTVQADPAYPAANVLSKIVVVNDQDSTRQKCIASLAGAASMGSLSLGFKAQTTIKVVVLVPGRNAAWTNNQKDVTVKVTDVSGTVQTCGIVTDFNTYSEQVCNKSGNLVTLARSTANVQLSFCSIGIFSDCNCAQSSFDSANIFPFPNQDKILQTTSVNVTLGASQSKSTTIPINSQISDTVSSVCGNADSKSYCGDRVISFTDAASGEAINSWPFRDFFYESGTLILSPTTAQTTVIKVTIGLFSNPNVNKAEVLTVIVNPAPVAQYIPNQQLSATVNTTAGLLLPRTDLPSTFKILSNQDFAADITGTFLTILSVKASDYGKTYSVSVSSVPNDANMPTSYFSVQVKFASAPVVTQAISNSTASSSSEASPQVSNQTVQAPTQDQAAQIISIDQSATVNPSAVSTSITVSASDLELKYDCAQNDQKEMVCIDKKTGQKCKFNDKTRKLDCSVVQTAAVKITIPTVTVSPVSNMGIFQIKFSEPMNMKRFLNTTSPEPKSRSLRASAKTIPVFNASQELENQFKYLFNSSYLDVQTVSGGLVNSTMLDQTWKTTNITDTVITMQARFMHPEYVSSEGAQPDSLKITMLQSKMSAYVSLKGQTVVELPQNVIRVLPVQLNLGQSSANLQQSASTLESVGQGTVAGQIVMNVVLSQAMSMMWSFVNALQIILTMPLLNIPMPGFVYLLMQNLSSLASFDVFPTEDILNFMFQFTETDTAGVGFNSMGITSNRLIPYLGSTFLFMIIVSAQIFAWLCCYILRKAHPFFERAQKKLKKFLFWSAILRLGVQGCLDISIGMMISLDQLEWKTQSDIFDSLLTFISVPVMVALPLFLYLFLKKNFKILQLPSFSRKFQPLFEGFLVETDAQKKRTTPYMAWFILRRQLLALVVVPLRNQTIWLQLTGNTWLTLADVCVKIHLSPYENYMGGIMEKINDTLVLFAGYFIYLFTDYSLTLENKAIFGWFFNGTVGFMIALNLSVMLTLGGKDLIKKVKRGLIIRHNKKIMALKGLADLEKKEGKTFDQRVAEALGLVDLMKDPSEISEEAKEDILYERGEENIEQVIARQQEDILIGVKVAKYKTKPDNQNFFGHNDYVQLLEDFKFNDPEYWHDGDLIKLSDRTRQNEEQKSVLDTEELIEDQISFRNAHNTRFEAIKRIEETDKVMDRMMLSSDPFGRYRGMYVQHKFGDYRKKKPAEQLAINKSQDLSQQTGVRLNHHQDLDLSESSQSGVVQMVTTISDEDESKIKELPEPTFKEEKSIVLNLVQNRRKEIQKVNQVLDGLLETHKNMLGEDQNLPVQQPERDNVERMSLESVEGIDPAILRQERDFLENQRKKKAQFIKGQMPQTIKGKGIPDRAYEDFGNKRSLE